MGTVLHAGRKALLASGGALALGLGIALSAPAAFAAEVAIDDATLSWGMSKEVGGGAYFGGCNFLSAGTAGNSGSSRLWTEGDAFYSGQTGNVTIVKPGTSGELEQVTWATKCLDSNGAAVTPGGTSSSLNRVEFAAGAGTVDLATGVGSISWTGSYTVVFYGGLTYWTVSDPQLTVDAEGNGQLTGTASGYGTDQNDTSLWTAIPAQEIVLADLTGVTLTEDGFEITPNYLGVVSGQAGQVTTGAVWGSFPASFVAFQQLTGQVSYWNSSGGGADPKKVASPIAVAWTVDAPAVEEGDIPVEVIVPEVEEPAPGPGEFTWTIAGGAPAIDMGTATAGVDSFVANGTLPTVTVTDTRETQAAWTLNGSVGDFVQGAKTFSGSHLGWTPIVAGTNTVGAVAGTAIVPATGQGLKAAATLASSAVGHPKGTAEVSAAVKLKIPLATEAGSYRAVLTLTAIG